MSDNTVLVFQYCFHSLVDGFSKTMLFFDFLIYFVRGVFKKARDDNRSNFHVYVAAALMEYYCSKVTFTLLTGHK